MLTALVTTAVHVGGKRAVIAPGQPLPETLSDADVRALLAGA